VTDDDFGKFRELMDGVAAQYKTEPLSAAGLSMMFQVLRKVGLQDVCTALMRHMEICKFFPRSADILAQINGTAADRSSAAFQKLLAAQRRCGYTASVRFSDPAIHYAVTRLGGWEQTCTWTQEELPFREKDFARQYEAAERWATWNEVPGVLQGYIERLNRAHGAELPKPLEAATGRPLETGPDRLRELAAETAGVLEASNA